jgi:biotin synthase
LQTWLLVKRGHLLALLDAWVYIVADMNDALNGEYTREAVLRCLMAEGEDLKDLYRKANALRHEYMGDTVYIRGIIEFSNICANNCLYCGIRASNKKVERYIIKPDEILDIARAMVKTVQTTVVLQSGEGSGLTDDEFGRMIKEIKEKTSLSITVSVGNRPFETYCYWHECGMDRYLLRFETSDPELFQHLHSGSTLDDRIACIGHLKKLGVQTGSGFMIGLPGEKIETLADNILLCRTLDLDMIGIGPFIPHPDTPLGREKNIYNDKPEMFFKVLAALRIFNADAHIPATTAYDVIFPGKGRDLALQRGANIFMPNSTPVKYKQKYFLYPGKPYVDESPEECTASAVHRIQVLGRHVGSGPGHSIKKRERNIS